MAFEVMHGDCRNTQRQGQRIGETRPHQQGTRQTRPLRVGDGVKITQGQASLGQHPAGEWNHPPDVIARSQFRHHPAVFGMHGHLAVHGLRKQATPGIEQGQAGFIAGRFDAKDEHGKSI